MESNSVDSKDKISGDVAFEKVRSLLPQFQSAMMVTRTSNGGLHVRPLALQGDLVRFGGVLWFFTDERSRKVQELANAVPVSIICQSDQHSTYRHLAGKATDVHGSVKMRERYSPVLKAGFPERLDDPDLTLVRFGAASGDG